ncbi:MAG: hypothetical protein GXO42_01170 [bacterium]|nr:hypothetical protein [bacterium]
MKVALLVLAAVICAQLAFTLISYVPPQLERQGVYYYWCWGSCTFLMCNPAANYSYAGSYTLQLGSTTVQFIPVAGTREYKIVVNGQFCGYLLPPAGDPCPVAMIDTVGLNLVLAQVELLSSSPACRLLSKISVLSPNSKINATRKVPQPNISAVLLRISSGYNRTIYNNISAEVEASVQLVQPLPCGRLVLGEHLHGKYRSTEQYTYIYKCTAVYKLYTSKLEQAAGKPVAQLLQEYKHKLLARSCQLARVKVNSSTKQQLNYSADLRLEAAQGYKLFVNCQGNSCQCCLPSANATPENYLLASVQHLLVYRFETPVTWKFLEPSNLAGTNISAVNVSRLLHLLLKQNISAVELEAEPSQGKHVLAYDIIDPKCRVVLASVYVDLASRITRLKLAWGYSPKNCSVREYKICTIKGALLPRVVVSVNKTKTRVIQQNGSKTVLAVLPCGELVYENYSYTEASAGKNITKSVNRLVFVPAKKFCASFLQCCRGGQCKQLVFSFPPGTCPVVIKNATAIINIGQQGIEKIVVNLAGKNYSIYYSSGQTTSCFCKRANKTVTAQPNTELASLEAILKHEHDKVTGVPVVIDIAGCARIIIENNTLNYTILSSCPYSVLPRKSFTAPGYCTASIGKLPAKQSNYYIIRCYAFKLPFLTIAYNSQHLYICSIKTCQELKGKLNWIFLSSANGWKKIVKNASGVYTSQRLVYSMKRALTEDICSLAASGKPVYVVYYQHSWWLALPLSRDTAKYFMDYGAGTTVVDLAGHWFLLFSRAYLVDQQHNEKLLYLQEVTPGAYAAIIRIADPAYSLKLQKAATGVYRVQGLTIQCSNSTWKVQTPGGEYYLLAVFGRNGTAIKYEAGQITVERLGARLPSAAKQGVYVNSSGDLVFGKPDAYLGPGRGALVAAHTASFSFPFIADNAWELVLLVLLAAALLCFRKT